MKEFIDIKKYMLLSREERRNHLCLEESCIEIGGDSRLFRGLLAHYLQTTIGDRKTYVCHACYNPKCSNPRHLYWGTPTDNVIDTKESGRYKSFYSNVIEKYGFDAARDMRRKAASLGGKAGGGRNALTPEEIAIWKNAIESIDVTKFGFVSKISEKMNCSHTHVRRILNKYFPEIQSFKREKFRK